MGNTYHNLKSMINIDDNHYYNTSVVPEKNMGMPLWQHVPTRTNDNHYNTPGLPEKNMDMDRIHNFGSGKAYFRPLPPAFPLELVLVGSIPEPACFSKKMQQLIQNIQTIETVNTSKLKSLQNKCKLVENEPAAGMETDQSSKTKLLKKHRGSKKAHKEVHKLLLELVLKLPVDEGREGASARSRSRCCRNLIGHKHTSPMGIELGRRSYYEIAVQARSDKISTEHKMRCKSTPDYVEWIGGVRALRDSHVRLVQRQLRHIEQLNRALDRVSHRSAAGAGASSSTHLSVESVDRLK